MHALPRHATVKSVAANARCQVCGSKGAFVEVVQPLAEIGEQRGASGPRNIEHAARLKSYIQQHPFGPPTSSRVRAMRQNTEKVSHDLKSRIDRPNRRSPTQLFPLACARRNSASPIALDCHIPLKDREFLIPRFGRNARRIEIRVLVF